MIFPILKSDLVVQIMDKIVFDSSKTFVTPEEDAVSLIELEPETGLGFFDITETNSLSWSYMTAGSKTATLRVTAGASTQNIELNLLCLTEAQDRLFSSDNDLMGHEPKIYDYLPKEYSSFNHLHRSSQAMIMDSFSQRGYQKSVGVPLNKNDLFNIEEVKQWSKFLTLSTIFSGSSNEVNDFFSVKAQQYKELAERSAQRAYITLDTNQDGDPETQLNLTVGRLVRR